MSIYSLIFTFPESLEIRIVARMALDVFIQDEQVYQLLSLSLPPCRVASERPIAGDNPA